MNKIYSLDTNIISYFLKGSHGIFDKIKNILLQGSNININPITYYEIKRDLLAINNQNMLNKFELFYGKFDLKSIEDADILFASNFIKYNYILVINNIKHFKNIETLNYEDWVDR
ncbi:MAG: hypothetical protein FWF50_06045 [Defluviitaleaceae bacterium]|nr:hypothetical protein [Defluviitaleaceae bacterium]